MKAIIYILILISTFHCNAQTSWSGSKSSSGKFSTLLPPCYVMIVTGQSNSISRNTSIASQFTANPNLTKHFDSTTSTFPLYSSSGTFATGFETQSGGLQAVIRGDTIYQIRVGVSSQDIFQWSKTDQAPLWLNLKRNIDSAFAVIRRSGKRPVPISIIWLQGEQNVYVATSQATYQSKMDSLVTNIRALDGTLSSTQFAMVYLRSNQTYSANPVTTVNTSFDNIVSTRVNCIVINPNTINANLTDGAHYDTGGYKKIADEWSRLIP